MTGKMPVPASLEVVGEHMAAHPCGVHPEPMDCPCGQTTVVLCGRCGEPVFFAVTTWCAHAEALWRAHGPQDRIRARRHRRPGR